MLRAVAGTIVSVLLSAGCALASESPSCSGPRGGKPGQCAPDFAATTLEGKTVRLSSLRGKVVFLNFWATWCPPCATEIPAMEDLYRAMKGKPFEMLAVSIDSEGAETVRRYLRDTFRNRPPSFPILLDAGKKISERYGTFKVPETYLIDASGRVRDRIEGIRDWNDPLIVHYLELLSRQAEGCAR